MAFVDNTFSFEEFDLEDEIDETKTPSPVAIEADYDSDDSWDSDDPDPPSSEDEDSDDETETEPVPVVDETPVPVIDETPVPVIDETPMPVIDETPMPVIDETPMPMIDETPMPAIDETDETDETDIDEAEMPDLVGSLAEMISSNLGDEIEAAVRDATKLLAALRKKQRSIKKKAKKAAVAPKPRAKYGAGIPTAAQLFAKANRASAVEWYTNGGRVPDFNPGKAQQIIKHLAIMWKLSSRDTRAEFDDMRNGIIAQKEEAIAAAAGVPIAA